MANKSGGNWFEENVTRIANGNPIFVKIVGRERWDEKCRTLVVEEAEQREKKLRWKRARGRDAGARGTP